MYLWLIRNLKYALPLLGALAALVFFGLWRLEVDETRNLEAQIDTLQDTVLDLEDDLRICGENVIKSEEIASAHSSKISALNRQLSEYRKLRDPKNARCIPVR